MSALSKAINQIGYDMLLHTMTKKQLQHYILLHDERFTLNQLMRAFPEMFKKK